MFNLLRPVFRAGDHVSRLTDALPLLQVLRRELAHFTLDDRTGSVEHHREWKSTSGVAPCSAQLHAGKPRQGNRKSDRRVLQEPCHWCDLVNRKADDLPAFIIIFGEEAIQ